MPKKIGYKEDYIPMTPKGKKLETIFDQLEQKERIYQKEKGKMIKRQAVVEAKKRLGLIKPKPISKKFRGFINSKIGFGR